jgi:hypothetical protein
LAFWLDDSAMTESEIKRKLKQDIRYDIIKKAINDPDWTAEQASEVLQLTVRQVFRLMAKVKAHGPDGLTHGNRGRQPATTLDDDLHRRVLDLYRDVYRKHNFTYTHFTEFLADDHQITVSRETVRHWLKVADLGRKAKRYCRHRLKRERRARKGQWLFLDGSPHRWFGNGQPRVTLILATDDATSEPLYGLLRPHETRDACFEVLFHVAQRFGLPEVLYLDRGSVFKTTRHGGIHAYQISEDETAFQIAMRKLGVKIIFADSPQARGRGERMNGSFQGRLVAELSLRGLRTMDAANPYINETFIPRYARRFAVAPRDPASAFRPIPEGLDLRRVLCKESTRRVESDNTVRLGGRLYQLYPPHSSPALYGAKVTVQEWFNGSVHVYYHTIGEIRNQLLPHLDVYRMANRHDRQYPTDKVILP